jgi:hypothetical protein
MHQDDIKEYLDFQKIFSAKKSRGYVYSATINRKQLMGFVSCYYFVRRSKKRNYAVVRC